MILSAHPGLQAPSRVSHSEGGGSLLGKQLQRGSLIKSHPKIVGSSPYLRPAQQFPCQARVSTLCSCSSCSRVCTSDPHPNNKGHCGICTLHSKELGVQGTACIHVIKDMCRQL